MTNEEDVRDALNSNICLVVNMLMSSEGYNFTRLQTHTPGIPDFNCYLGKLLILVIEVKRKHVLEDIGGRRFPEFYQDNDKARMVVQQIYNYMGANERRYGILTTYDNHWFLRREHTMLWISETLSLQSKSPPVLKAYAYLARQAKDNPESLNPYRVPFAELREAFQALSRSEQDIFLMAQLKALNDGEITASRRLRKKTRTNKRTNHLATNGIIPRVHAKDTQNDKPNAAALHQQNQAFLDAFKTLYKDPSNIVELFQEYINKKHAYWFDNQTNHVPNGTLFQSSGYGISQN
ncbi:hypothetical protein G9A89_021218 [Geosiphon pyriformis]|nr:hypothetical protein G9A89_021218 [Geosiphon pyriformis]